MQFQGNGNDKSQFVVGGYNKRKSWGDLVYGPLVGKYPSQKQSINIMTHKQGHYGLICCCYAYGIITFFLKICNNFVVAIVIIARLRMLLCGWVKNSEIIHYFLVKSSVCLVVCQFHLSHTQTLSVLRHAHSFFAFRRKARKWSILLLLLFLLLG